MICGILKRTDMISYILEVTSEGEMPTTRYSPDLSLESENRGMDFATSEMYLTYII